MLKVVFCHMMFRMRLFLICDRFLLDVSPNYSMQLFGEHLPPPARVYDSFGKK